MQDFARNQRSPMTVDHITRVQFRQCLARLALEVSEEEAIVLQEKYDDDGVGNMNYVSFCRDVDTAEVCRGSLLALL